jgi:hypothetical protein
MDWPLLKHLWGRGRRAEHPQACRQLDGRAVCGAVLSTLKPIARRHWSGRNAWLSVLWISTCEIAAISAHQWLSVAIRGHQWPSEVISGHQSLHLLEYERIPRLQRHLWGSDREAMTPW